MAEPVIIVNNVTKAFKLPHERRNSIKSAFVGIFRKSRTFERQVALQDISFEVKKGEFFGVVGRNGSGKSTLLKMLAGIYSPNKGALTVNGKLTPFIELGVGFNPELTGRENVFLNGALLGFSRKEMSEMYDDIVDFAELERFMDQKLKNYSSGMQVRLAFSVAIRTQSDGLLVDEVLAVGDALFQQKCYDYFDKLKNSDKTVVFISHDMGAVQTFCDRAILINDSKLVAEGKPQDIVQKYNEILAAGAPKPEYENNKLVHAGVGGAEIVKAEIRDKQGKVVNRIAEGEPFSVRVHYVTKREVKDVVIGLGIMGQKGQSILGPNTKESGHKIETLKDTGYYDVEFTSNPLSSGTYRIRSSIMNSSGTIPYDFIEKLATLTVVGKKRFGEIYIEPKWKIH
jgi:ABC-2 type transport system ATP-binding protein